MKIIWTLLIGMLIFQSLFVAFAVFFDTSETNIEGLENISSSTEGYENLSLTSGGGIWGMITGLAGSIAISILTIVGIAIAIAAKNYVGAAIALYLGFVSWLYVQTSGILVRMNDIGGGSPVGLAFIGLFGVVLAILVVKSIIEMLAPGGID